MSFFHLSENAKPIQQLAKHLVKGILTKELRCLPLIVVNAKDEKNFQHLVDDIRNFVIVCIQNWYIINNVIDFLGPATCQYDKVKIFLLYQILCHLIHMLFLRKVLWCPKNTLLEKLIQVVLFSLINFLNEHAELISCEIL